MGERANNEGVSQMINDPRIAAVTVTGSVRAGAAIGAQAGAALKSAYWNWVARIVVLNDASRTGGKKPRLPDAIKTPD